MSSSIYNIERLTFLLLVSICLVPACSSSSDPAETDSVSLEPPVQVGIELLPDKTFRISWQQTAGAEFYRVLENPDGVSGFSQISEDLDVSTQTHDHRVALYKRVNARYVVQACNDVRCLDSEPLFVSGTLEQAIGYFKASNTDNVFTDSLDQFGQVSLSEDGSTLAVGAPGEDSSATGVNGNQTDNTAFNSGAVYLFERSDGNWQQQAYLKASNTSESQSFGFDVSLSANGNVLAVGAPGNTSVGGGITTSNLNDTSDAGVGSVYMFERTNGIWVEQAQLKASNADPGDQFGATLSLSSDGAILSVGAPGEDSEDGGININADDNSAIDAGAVYVFERSDELWQQHTYLKPSTTNSTDRFGTDVSLSGDGNTLAVGVPLEGSSATGINGDQNDNGASAAGAVYVFVRDEGNWEQQAFLKASNTDSVDRFGGSVSLNADGNTLAVGASDEDSSATGIGGDQDDNSTLESGAVYVFERGNGVWQQQSYLKASNTDAVNRFGIALSLSADGMTLAVGSHEEDSLATGINGNQNLNGGGRSGAVYVFDRSNGNWQQQAYVKASNADEQDLFGEFVSLSADGNSLAVGALGEDGSAVGINGNQSDNSLESTGAVYLY